MASTTTASTYKLSFDHPIDIKVHTELEPTYYSRAVANGKLVRGSLKVSSFRTESARDAAIPVMLVNTYQEYVAGCSMHGDGCFGHLCVTPRGSILLPQKLASTLGVMSNDYAKLAENLFARDSYSQEMAYREELRSLALGKSGKMRGDIGGGPVDCSGREVIVGCWELDTMSVGIDEGTIFFAVPRRVAENMRILRVARDPISGKYMSTYSEDMLREHDWLVVIRCPSTGPLNVQCMKVVLWDHECFGLSPSIADEFHADFDGDEMHIYSVTTKEAIEECIRWTRHKPNKFAMAMKPRNNGQAHVSKGKELLRNIRLPRNIDLGDSDITSRFMQHSTVSIQEILDGIKMPDISPLARMKEDMVNMLAVRMRDPEGVSRSFISDCKRGIRDIMKQQGNQGYLGNMTRQARLAASCVKYVGNGYFDIAIGNTTTRTFNMNACNTPRDMDYPLFGNSCMRAVSAFCGVAQQAALDSHRVKVDKRESTHVTNGTKLSMDLIENLMVGGGDTIVCLSDNVPGKYKWNYVQEGTGVTFRIAEIDDLKHVASKIIGAYNPVVLGWLELLGHSTRLVCEKGLSIVCNYYSIRLSEEEMKCAVELFTYAPGASNYPITTKEGMVDRDMRWMVVLFATHYGRFRSMQLRRVTNKFTDIDTIVEADAYCNYRPLI